MSKKSKKIESDVNAWQHMLTSFAKYSLNVIHAKDNYTKLHSKGVGWFSDFLFTRYLHFYEEKNRENFLNLAQKWQEHLFCHYDPKHDTDLFNHMPHLTFSCRLHDVGKIKWSDKLLVGEFNFDKNRDDKEFEKFKAYKVAHPQDGVMSICNNLLNPAKDLGVNIEDQLWIILVMLHHKHYNDNHSEESYPNIEKELEKLYIWEFFKNKAISFSVKENNSELDSDFIRVALGIISIADVIDAMCSYRPYRSNGSEKDYQSYDTWFKYWEQAIDEIKNKRATKFHPDVCDALLTYDINSLSKTFFKFKESMFLLHKIIQGDDLNDLQKKIFETIFEEEEENTHTISTKICDSLKLNLDDFKNNCNDILNKLGYDTVSKFTKDFHKFTS